MKTDSNKVKISVDTQIQQETVIQNRKSIKGLQYQVNSANKENLHGYTHTPGKLIKSEQTEFKKPIMVSKSIQVGEITVNDLTSTEEPGADYWKKLAEKRQDILNQSLEENEQLKHQIVSLQEENKVCKEMLEEARHLVEVLNEMTDPDAEDEDTKTHSDANLTEN